MFYFRYILKNPQKLSIRNIRRGIVLLFSRFYTDKRFLEALFPLIAGYKLNLEAPKTFNEKLQWLKLYDRRPEYTIMVDKYEVKEYVAGIIGWEHIIPTLAVYNCVEDLDYDYLPPRFVLKCTHDSGGVIVCKDKSVFDKTSAEKKLAHKLKSNYYTKNREWPYKNIRPRIIAEEYKEDKASLELVDYKFYCFSGQPRVVMVASGRFSEKKTFAYFDTDWNKLNITWGAPNPEHYPEKPQNYDQMLEIARKLSNGIPHVRVDLYNIDGIIYFGELTFFDGSGMQKITPIEWDYRMGEWIDLPINS